MMKFYASDGKQILKAPVHLGLDIASAPICDFGTNDYMYHLI